MAAVDTNLLGSLKWTGGVRTVIDSVVVHFLAYISFLKQSAEWIFQYSVDKYYCPSILCTVEKRAAHSYEDFFKKKLQQVLTKHQENFSKQD